MPPSQRKSRARKHVELTEKSDADDVASISTPNRKRKRVGRRTITTQYTTDKTLRLTPMTLLDSPTKPVLLTRNRTARNAGRRAPATSRSTRMNRASARKTLML